MICFVSLIKNEYKAKQGYKYWIHIHRYEADIEYDKYTNVVKIFLITVCLAEWGRRTPFGLHALRIW